MSKTTFKSFVKESIYYFVHNCHNRVSHRLIKDIHYVYTWMVCILWLCPRMYILYICSCGHYHSSEKTKWDFIFWISCQINHKIVKNIIKYFFICSLIKNKCFKEFSFFIFKKDLIFYLYFLIKIKNIYFHLTLFFL